MANETFLTEEAYKQLQDKLAFLKCEGRIDIANKIKVARSFGDISENSEYDAARNEEAAMELEISEIEEKLRKAKIISKLKVDQNKANIGCTVEVYDKEFDETVTFKIMGSSESNPAQGLISNESPIGKALIGKEVGDVVVVDNPGVDKIQYKILSIKY